MADKATAAVIIFINLLSFVEKGVPVIKYRSANGLIKAKKALKKIFLKKFKKTLDKTLYG